MSKSKTEFVSSFTAHHHNTLSNVRKEVKVTLLTEANETKHKETHLMKKSISNIFSFNREMLIRISIQSKIIKSINFKGMDTNTKKMKFIKK